MAYEQQKFVTVLEAVKFTTEVEDQCLVKLLSGQGRQLFAVSLNGRRGELVPL